MPVEITNQLTPAMQAVADCREAVKNAAADVESHKLSLKEAKAAWERTVEALNEAIDAAIDAERQPTLFDKFGRDNLDNPPQPATVATPPDQPGGSGGDADAPVVTVQVEVNPDGVPSLPAADLSVKQIAEHAAKLARWRELKAAEELEIPPHIVVAFDAHGVVTLGDLAAGLVEGKTFGLKLVEVEELKEGIEQVSANDPEPVTFDDHDSGSGVGGDQDADEDESAARKPAVMFGQPQREDFPGDFTGKWEHQIAVKKFHGNAGDREERQLRDIAAYRERLKVDANPTPQWGEWCEFEVTVANAAKVSVVVSVLYQPNTRSVEHDYIEFRSSCISPTGFWSEEVRHPGGKRPTGKTLAEWAREMVQQQADTFAADQKAKHAKKGGGGKGGGGKKQSAGKKSA